MEIDDKTDLAKRISNSRKSKSFLTIRKINEFLPSINPNMGKENCLACANELYTRLCNQKKSGKEADVEDSGRDNMFIFNDFALMTEDRQAQVLVPPNPNAFIIDEEVSSHTVLKPKFPHVEKASLIEYLENLEPGPYNDEYSYRAGILLLNLNSNDKWHFLNFYIYKNKNTVHKYIIDAQENKTYTFANFAKKEISQYSSTVYVYHDGLANEHNSQVIETNWPLQFDDAAAVKAEEEGLAMLPSTDANFSFLHLVKVKKETTDEPDSSPVMLKIKKEPGLFEDIDSGPEHSLQHSRKREERTKIKKEHKNQKIGETKVSKRDKGVTAIPKLVKLIQEAFENNKILRRADLCKDLGIHDKTLLIYIKKLIKEKNISEEAAQCVVSPKKLDNHVDERRRAMAEKLKEARRSGTYIKLSDFLKTHNIKTHIWNTDWTAMLESNLVEKEDRNCLINKFNNIKLRTDLANKITTASSESKLLLRSDLLTEFNITRKTLTNNVKKMIEKKMITAEESKVIINPNKRDTAENRRLCLIKDINEANENKKHIKQKDILEKYNIQKNVFYSDIKSILKLNQIKESDLDCIHSKRNKKYHQLEQDIKNQVDSKILLDRYGYKDINLLVTAVENKLKLKHSDLTYLKNNLGASDAQDGINSIRAFLPEIYEERQYVPFDSLIDLKAASDDPVIQNMTFDLFNFRARKIINEEFFPAELRGFYINSSSAFFM